MRVPSTLIACALLPLAAPAFGQSSAEEDPASVRARAEEYLGTIDRPVTASAWKALGADAVPFLEEALRTDPIAARRSAAAIGLAAIGGDRASEALLQAARTESERWSVRAAAVRGLGTTLPPDRLTRALRPLMEGAATSQVRGAAADVLARHAPALACAAVRSQLAREGAASSEPTFSRAATRCRGR